MWIIDQQYIKLGKPGRTPGRNQEVELTYKFPEFKENVILWTIIHLNCTLTSVLLLLYTTIAEISKFCPNIMRTFVIHWIYHSKELNHLAAILHVYAGRFEFYEVKKSILLLFFKKKMEILLYTFYHFYSEKSSKRAK